MAACLSGVLALLFRMASTRPSLRKNSGLQRGPEVFVRRYHRTKRIPPSFSLLFVFAWSLGFFSLLITDWPRIRPGFEWMGWMGSYRSHAVELGTCCIKIVGPDVTVLRIAAFENVLGEGTLYLCVCVRVRCLVQLNTSGKVHARMASAPPHTSSRHGKKTSTAVPLNGLLRSSPQMSLDIFRLGFVYVCTVRPQPTLPTRERERERDPRLLRRPISWALFSLIHKQPRRYNSAGHRGPGACSLVRASCWRARTAPRTRPSCAPLR